MKSQNCDCTACPMFIPPNLAKRVEIIKRVYLEDNREWFVGYSGGKDSSAVVKLIFQALLSLENPKKKITIVYCDTGVDIPLISSYVKDSLRSIKDEADKNNLPIEVQTARPEIENSFFVKVIGRGYPPPSNIFRWCTNKLRVDPIRKVIGDRNNALVVLGVRRGESPQRDRTIDNHRKDLFMLEQTGTQKYELFCPILDFDVNGVWSTILSLEKPTIFDSKKLMNLYRESSGECPTVSTKGSPCGKGRFGCWTCTVVRRDKAVTNLVAEGHDNLKPLLEFRNWLQANRDKPHYRRQFRRNGLPGPGPLNLKMRKILLFKLLEAQKESGFTLISKEEIRLIKRHWKIDGEHSRSNQERNKYAA